MTCVRAWFEKPVAEAHARHRPPSIPFPAASALRMVFLSLVLAIRPLREFFGTNLLSAGDYLVIGAIVVGWTLVLRYAYKTQALGRYFGYAPAP